MKEVKHEEEGMGVRETELVDDGIDEVMLTWKVVGISVAL